MLRTGVFDPKETAISTRMGWVKHTSKKKA
jgi:hypothetical protein